MECHKNSFTERVEDSLLLMREVASPAFQMYYQPHQWKSVAENLEMAEKLAPFTHVIHVFEWKGSDRFPLAEGLDEWRAYLDKLPDTPPLLLEFMPDNELSTLPVEAASLRRIVNAPTPKGDPT
jgi:hypothetical protein